MPNLDLTDVVTRRNLINEINSGSNKARKYNEQRKSDVYKKKAAGYVLERLRDEFDGETVNSMRKVTSINPAKRIVDEQASLYSEEPRRHWVNATDAESDQLDDIYDYSSVNPQMRLANRYYKLHSQAALYVVPRAGKLTVRALTPKDYDVVPDADDPEKAFAYILNVADLGNYDAQSITPAEASRGRYVQSQTENQAIADGNDSKALESRYVWWSDDLHFTTDGFGNLIGETDQDGLMTIENPIGRLPFVDVAHEKDFKFFVEQGSDVVDFTIDLLVQLSDLCNTTKFQAYSQAIIYSVDEPKGLQIGPNRVLWLKVDPNGEASHRPEFKFENPSPDLAGTLEILNAQLKMFLTSQGLSPGVVSGRNEVEKFTSGVDHLLANLDKFKATREDMDLFRQVETHLLEIILAWHDLMMDVGRGEGLDDVYREARIGESVYLDVVYHEPEAVQTDTETLAYVKDARLSGLMTRVEAVKRIYKVDDPTAEKIIKDIDDEKDAEPPILPPVPPIAGETEVLKQVTEVVNAETQDNPVQD